MKPRYSIGERIGRLKVIEILPAASPSRRIIYVCQCDCGVVVRRNSPYFQKSKVLNCGCIDPRKETDRENAILKRLFHFKIENTRQRIRRETNLSFEEFKKNVKLPCFYCGEPYSMSKGDIIRGRAVSETVVNYNGIDRVDSKGGYTSKNVVPCCSTCNMAKRLMSKHDFFKWVKKVYEFNKL